MGIPPFKQITGAAGELADELTANNLLRRQIKNSPNVSITSHFSLISRLRNIIVHFKEVQLEKFGFRSAPRRRSFIYFFPLLPYSFDQTLPEIRGAAVKTRRFQMKCLLPVGPAYRPLS